MPIHYEVDPTYHNLLISTVYPPFDPLIDTQAALKSVTFHLRNIKGNIYILSDLRLLDVSFAELIIGMATAAFKEQSPLRSDRVNIAQVAQRGLYKMIAEWFKDDLYGALEIPTFKTYDAAKAHLVQKIIDDTTSNV